MTTRESFEAQLRRLEQFAPSVELVLADPFAELTRKRQAWLIGCALACVVLSTRVATLSEASILGLKFTADAQPALLMVLRFVCGYLMLVFAASAYQDLKRFNYKTIPARSALIRVGLELHDESSSALGVVAEAQDRLTQIAEEAAAIAKRSEPRLSDADQRRLLELPMLASAASEDARRGSRTLDSILDKILDSHPIETRVRLFRIVIEVSAPLVLGVYAIWPISA